MSGGADDEGVYELSSGGIDVSSPPPAPVHLDHKASGNAAFGSKDFGAAVKHYTSAYTSAPEGDDTFKSVVLSNRSASKRQLQDLDGAVEDARLSLKFDGGSVKSHYRLATYLFDKGAFGEVRSAEVWRAVVWREGRVERARSDEERSDELEKGSLRDAGARSRYLDAAMDLHPGRRVQRTNIVSNVTDNIHFSWTRFYRRVCFVRRRSSQSLEAAEKGLKQDPTSRPLLKAKVKAKQAKKKLKSKAAADPVSGFAHKKDYVSLYPERTEKHGTSRSLLLQLKHELSSGKASKTHTGLSGMFKRLMDPQLFRDTVFPGLSEEVSWRGWVCTLCACFVCACEGRY